MDDKEIIIRALTVYSSQLEKQLEFFNPLKDKGLKYVIPKGIQEEYNNCIKILSEVTSGKLEIE